MFKLILTNLNRHTSWPAPRFVVSSVWSPSYLRPDWSNISPLDCTGGLYSPGASAPGGCHGHSAAFLKFVIILNANVQTTLTSCLTQVPDGDNNVSVIVLYLILHLIEFLVGASSAVSYLLWQPVAIFTRYLRFLPSPLCLGWWPVAGGPGDADTESWAIERPEGEGGPSRGEIIICSIVHG